MQLSGRTVVVTGAAAGIGLALAEAVATAADGASKAAVEARASA